MLEIQNKITIVKVRHPKRKDLNDQLQFLGSSLGLFNSRDKDRSMFRIFIELLKVARRDKGLSSDELASQLKLTRGTVIHHLNKLMECGLVLRSGNSYHLRESSLRSVVDEVEKDLGRTLQDVKVVAREIDGWLEM